MQHSLTQHEAGHAQGYIELRRGFLRQAILHTQGGTLEPILTRATMEKCEQGDTTAVAAMVNRAIVSALTDDHISQIHMRSADTVIRAIFGNPGWRRLSDPPPWEIGEMAQ